MGKKKPNVFQPLPEQYTSDWGVTITDPNAQLINKLPLTEEERDNLYWDVVKTKQGQDNLTKEIQKDFEIEGLLGGPTKQDTKELESLKDWNLRGTDVTTLQADRYEAESSWSKYGKAVYNGVVKGVIGIVEAPFLVANALLDPISPDYEGTLPSIIKGFETLKESAGLEQYQDPLKREGDGLFTTGNIAAGLEGLISSAIEFAAVGSVASQAMRGIGAGARGISKVTSKDLHRLLTNPTVNKVGTSLGTNFTLADAEGLKSALVIYEETRDALVAQGMGEEEAKLKAATAADATYSVNKINTLVSMGIGGKVLEQVTSLGGAYKNKVSSALGTYLGGDTSKLFTKGAGITRAGIGSISVKNTLNNALKEGIQEIPEELINTVSEAIGNDYKKAYLSDLEDAYALGESIGNQLSEEGLSAAMWGFLGGGANTIFSAAKSQATGETAKLRQRLAEQTQAVKTMLDNSNVLDNTITAKEFERIEGDLTALNRISQATMVGQGTGVSMNTTPLKETYKQLAAKYKLDVPKDLDKRDITQEDIQKLQSKIQQASNASLAYQLYSTGSVDTFLDELNTRLAKAEGNEKTQLESLRTQVLDLEKVYLENVGTKGVVSRLRYSLAAQRHFINKELSDVTSQYQAGVNIASIEKSLEELSTLTDEKTQQEDDRLLGLKEREANLKTQLTNLDKTINELSKSNLKQIDRTFQAAFEYGLAKSSGTTLATTKVAREGLKKAQASPKPFNGKKVNEPYKKDPLSGMTVLEANIREVAQGDDKQVSIAFNSNNQPVNGQITITPLQDGTSSVNVTIGDETISLEQFKAKYPDASNISVTDTDQDFANSVAQTVVATKPVIPVKDNTLAGANLSTQTIGTLIKEINKALSDVVENIAPYKGNKLSTVVGTLKSLWTQSTIKLSELLKQYNNVSKNLLPKIEERINTLSDAIQQNQATISSKDLLDGLVDEALKAKATEAIKKLENLNQALSEEKTALETLAQGLKSLFTAQEIFNGFNTALQDTYNNNGRTDEFQSQIQSLLDKLSIDGDAANTLKDIINQSILNVTLGSEVQPLKSASQLNDATEKYLFQIIPQIRDVAAGDSVVNGSYEDLYELSKNTDGTWNVTNTTNNTTLAGLTTDKVLSYFYPSVFKSDLNNLEGSGADDQQSGNLNKSLAEAVQDAVPSDSPTEIRTISATAGKPPSYQEAVANITDPVEQEITVTRYVNIQLLLATKHIAANANKSFRLHTYSVKELKALIDDPNHLLNGISNTDKQYVRNAKDDEIITYTVFYEDSLGNIVSTYNSNNNSHMLYTASVLVVESEQNKAGLRNLNYTTNKFKVNNPISSPTLLVDAPLGTQYTLYTGTTSKVEPIVTDNTNISVQPITNDKGDLALGEGKTINSTKVTGGLYIFNKEAQRGTVVYTKPIGDNAAESILKALENSSLEDGELTLERSVAGTPAGTVILTVDPINPQGTLANTIQFGSSKVGRTKPNPYSLTVSIVNDELVIQAGNNTYTQAQLKDPAKRAELKKFIANKKRNFKPSLFKATKPFNMLGMDGQYVSVNNGEELSKYILSSGIISLSTNLQGYVGTSNNIDYNWILNNTYNFSISTPLSTIGEWRSATLPPANPLVPDSVKTESKQVETKQEIVLTPTPEPVAFDLALNDTYVSYDSNEIAQLADNLEHPLVLDLKSRGTEARRITFTAYIAANGKPAYEYRAVKYDPVLDKLSIISYQPNQLIPDAETVPIEDRLTPDEFNALKVAATKAVADFNANLAQSKVEPSAKANSVYASIQSSLSGKTFKVTPTEYIDEAGVVYKRVSTLTPGKKAFSNNEASDRGTVIDTLLRAFVSNEATTSDALWKLYQTLNKGESLPFARKFVNDLFTCFSALKGALPNHSFYATTSTLWGTISTQSGNVKAAGTVDLLAIDNNTGEVTIIDLKSSSQNRKDTENTWYQSYQISDSYQQSGYAALFRQRTGITPNLLVFPIQVNSNSKEYRNAHLNNADGTIFAPVLINEQFYNSVETVDEPVVEESVEVISPDNWKEADDPFAESKLGTLISVSQNQERGRANTELYAQEYVDTKALSEAVKSEVLYLDRRYEAQALSLESNDFAEAVIKELMTAGVKLSPTQGASVKRDLIAYAEFVKDTIKGNPDAVAKYKDVVTAEGKQFTPADLHAKGLVLVNALSARGGTGYHEAFHAIFRLLPIKRKQKLADELRKRPDYKFLVATRIKLGYSNEPIDGISEAEEEVLAEEFRRGYLNDMMPTGNATKGFFKKLIAFLKSLIGLGEVSTTAQMRKLIKELKKGQAFKPVSTKGNGIKLSAINVITTNAQGNKTNTKIDYTTKVDILEGLTTFFAQHLFFDNGLSIFDLPKKEVKPFLNGLYDKVFNSYVNYLTERISKLEALKADSSKFRTPQTAAQFEVFDKNVNTMLGALRKTKEILTATEVVDGKQVYLNKNTFIEEHVNFLTLYGLDVTLKKPTTTTVEDETDQIVDVSTTKDNHIIESIKYDGSEKIPPQVKALFMGITQQSYIDTYAPGMSFNAPLKEVVELVSMSSIYLPRSISSQRIKQAFFKELSNTTPDGKAIALKARNIIAKMPEAKIVFDRLVGKYDPTDENPFFKSNNLANLTLQAKFFQAMAVAKYKYRTYAIKEGSIKGYDNSERATLNKARERILAALFNPSTANTPSQGLDAFIGLYGTQAVTKALDLLGLRLDASQPVSKLLELILNKENNIYKSPAVTYAQVLGLEPMSISGAYYAILDEIAAKVIEADPSVEDAFNRTADNEKVYKYAKGTPIQHQLMALERVYATSKAEGLSVEDFRTKVLEEIPMMRGLAKYGGYFYEYIQSYKAGSSPSLPSVEIVLALQRETEDDVDALEPASMTDLDRHALQLAQSQDNLFNYNTSGDRTRTFAINSSLQLPENGKALIIKMKQSYIPARLAYYAEYLRNNKQYRNHSKNLEVMPLSYLSTMFNKDILDRLKTVAKNISADSNVDLFDAIVNDPAYIEVINSSEFKEQLNAGISRVVSENTSRYVKNKLHYLGAETETIPEEYTNLPTDLSYVVGTLYATGDTYIDFNNKARKPNSNDWHVNIDTLLKKGLSKPNYLNKPPQDITYTELVSNFYKLVNQDPAKAIEIKKAILPMLGLSADLADKVIMDLVPPQSINDDAGSYTVRIIIPNNLNKFVIKDFAHRLEEEAFFNTSLLNYKSIVDAPKRIALTTTTKSQSILDSNYLAALQANFGSLIDLSMPKWGKRYIVTEEAESAPQELVDTYYNLFLQDNLQRISKKLGKPVNELEAAIRNKSERLAKALVKAYQDMSPMDGQSYADLKAYAKLKLYHADLTVNQQELLKLELQLADSLKLLKTKTAEYLKNGLPKDSDPALIAEYNEFIDSITKVIKKIYNKILANESALPSVKSGFMGAIASSPDDTQTFSGTYKESISPVLPSTLFSFREDGSIYIDPTFDMFYIDNEDFLLGDKSMSKTESLTKDGKLNDFDTVKAGEGFVEYFHWSGYGVQVEISEKIKEEVTTSTQMRALTFANMFDAGLPVDVNMDITEWESLSEPQKLASSRVYAMKLEYNQLQQQIVAKKLRLSYEELGLALIENNGNETYVIPKENQQEELNKLVDFLLVSAATNGIDDNFIRSVEAFKENGKLDFLANRERIEQIIFAGLLSDTYATKRNGNASPQVSIAVFEKAKGNLVVDPSVDPLRELKSYRMSKRIVDGNKVLLPAQIRIGLPPNFKPLLRVFKGLQGLNDAVYKYIKAQEDYYQGIDNEFDKGLVEGLTEDQVALLSKALNVSGFRIPAQAPNSGELLQIAGFLPPSAGNTVHMYKEIVAHSGGDFDIDKLNMYLYNFNETKDGVTLLSDIPSLEMYNDEMGTKYGMAEFEAMEPARQLTIKQLENRLLELEKQVMSHPAMLRSLISPTTTAILMDEEIGAVTKVRQALLGDSYNPQEGDTHKQWEAYQSKVKPNYLYYTAKYQTESAARAQFGKKGVGIVADLSKFFSLIQSTKVGLHKDALFTFYPNNTPKDTTGSSSLGKHAGLYSYLLGLTMDSKYNLTTETVSAFMNAFVDIAKDPYIKDVNISPDNFGAVALMLMTGADPEYVAFFMAQPVIQDYLLAYTNNKSISVKAFRREASNQQVVAETLMKYGAIPNQEIEPAIKNLTLLTNAHRQYIDSLGTKAFSKMAAELSKSIQTLNYSTEITQNQLEAAFKKNERNEWIPTGLEKQLLDQFLHLQYVSGILTGYMQSIKYDTSRPTNTWDAQNRLEDYNNILENNKYISKPYEAVNNTYLPQFMSNTERVTRTVDNMKAYSNIATKLGSAVAELQGFVILTTPEKRIAASERIFSLAGVYDMLLNSKMSIPPIKPSIADKAFPGTSFTLAEFRDALTQTTMSSDYIEELASTLNDYFKASKYWQGHPLSKHLRMLTIKGKVVTGTAGKGSSALDKNKVYNEANSLIKALTSSGEPSADKTAAALAVLAFNKLSLLQHGFVSNRSFSSNMLNQDIISGLVSSMEAINELTEEQADDFKKIIMFNPLTRNFTTTIAKGASLVETPTDFVVPDWAQNKPIYAINNMKVPMIKLRVNNKVVLLKNLNVKATKPDGEAYEGSLYVEVPVFKDATKGAIVWDLTTPLEWQSEVFQSSDNDYDEDVDTQPMKTVKLTPSTLAAGNTAPIYQLVSDDLLTTFVQQHNC